MLTVLRRLSEHLIWADELMLQALASAPSPSAELLRECGHVLGADEIWLARITSRPSRVPVWPELTLRELTALAEQVHADYTAYLDALTEADLHRVVLYTNSAGISFESQLRDILHHVFLHAQYHRGKMNLLLRQAGYQPSPVDFISFTRGFPAAKTGVSA
jgi:uncharacterized damage-inducible protein DinB